MCATCATLIHTCAVTIGLACEDTLLETNREEYVESEEESEECEESEDEPEVLSSHIKCDHLVIWNKPRILESHIQHKHKK